MITDPELAQLTWQVLDDLSILLTSAYQHGEDAEDLAWAAEQASASLEALR